jgi:hypothetical protein
MAAIALTIIILLNYLVFYYAYGVFEGSVRTKIKRFFPAKNPVDARREVVRVGLVPYGRAQAAPDCCRARSGLPTGRITQ